MDIENLVKKLAKSGIFWTVMIGIISVVASIYLTNKKREPVYYYHQNPVTVFYKSILNDDLKITFRDSVLLKGNIYATSIVLWNKGGLPIDRKDIRVPIGFQFPPEITLLDGKILEEHCEFGVSNFRIVSGDGNFHALDWEYFDPGSAVKIQLVYSSTYNYKPTVSGSILGSSVELISGEFKGANFWLVIVIMPLLFYFSGRILHAGLTQTKWREESWGQLIPTTVIMAFLGSGVIVAPYIIYMAITEYNYLPF